MRFAVVVLALVGCNQIYGLDGTQVRDQVDADTRPDIDQDGIADVEDPCISGAEDAAHDFDRDGISDRDDRCPFLGNVPADTDGDGIPDLCDPYPMSGGDRHRCTMTFQARPLNAALWVRRPWPDPKTAPMEIIPLTGQMAIFGSGEGVAVEDVLGSAASSSIEAPLGVSFAQNPFRVGVLLGAQPAPGPSDVACELESSAGQLRISVSGPMTVRSTPGPLPMIFDPNTEGTTFLVRAYLQPMRSGTNITCSAVYLDQAGNPIALRVRGHIDVPIGNVGLYGLNGFYSFFGLEIFERDDMPALP